MGKMPISGTVKVFGGRPMTVAPHGPGAGVRKPPREETAGEKARSCRARGPSYGDLRAAGWALLGSLSDRVRRSRALESMSGAYCSVLAASSGEDWRPS